MICPFCHGNDIKVLDSRPDSEGKSIRRRRECLSCVRRWRTVERVEDEMPMVIKKNGTFEPFDRDKLYRAICVSCGKRPVSKAQLEQLVADIEWALLEQGAETVSSIVLGEKVMSGLKKLDEIAYIRFASVYRRFKDAGELMAEMKDLLVENQKNA
jgi:transcriptional repressor NrdR